MSLKDDVSTDVDTQDQPPMSEALVELLRHRVATRYYDQPQVVDAIARAIHGASHVSVASANELC